MLLDALLDDAVSIVLNGVEDFLVVSLGDLVPKGLIHAALHALPCFPTRGYNIQYPIGKSLPHRVVLRVNSRLGGRAQIKSAPGGDLVRSAVQ